VSPIKSIQEQISKAEVILQESRENFAKDPENYSARLLLMSVENHIADLLQQLDSLQQPITNNPQ